MPFEGSAAKTKCQTFSKGYWQWIAEKWAILMIIKSKVLPSITAQILPFERNTAFDWVNKLNISLNPLDRWKQKTTDENLLSINLLKSFKTKDDRCLKRAGLKTSSTKRDFFIVLKTLIIIILIGYLYIQFRFFCSQFQQVQFPAQAQLTKRKGSGLCSIHMFDCNYNQ